MLNWQPVISSNISEVAYDAENSKLHVKFTGFGAAYVYRGVPATVFDDFMNAPSKGKFLAEAIKGRYEYYREL